MTIFAIQHNLKSIFYRSSKRYACVDGLRAIAILLLMIYHMVWFSAAYLSLPNFLSLVNELHLQFLFKADLQLDTFFVISGFLIARLLLVDYQKTGKIQVFLFYARRYLRLMPVYYVALLVVGFFAWHDPHSILGVVKNSWANVMYVNNYLLPREQFMGWSWSLGVEEQFYFIFPIFLIVLLKLKRWMILSILGMAFLSAIITIIFQVHRYGIYLPLTISPAVHFDRWSQWFYVLYSPLYTRFGPFICGIFLAFLKCYYTESLQKLVNHYRWILPALALSSLLMIGLIIVTPVYSRYSFPGWFSIAYLSSYRNLYGLGIMFIMLACFYPTHTLTRGINHFLSANSWYPIAQLSYSAFLFHPLVLYWLYGRLQAKPNVTPLDIVLIPFEFFGLSFAIALMAYLFIEKPFMNWRDRHLAGVSTREALKSPVDGGFILRSE